MRFNFSFTVQSQWNASKCPRTTNPVLPTPRWSPLWHSKNQESDCWPFDLWTSCSPCCSSGIDAHTMSMSIPECIKALNEYEECWYEDSSSSTNDYFFSWKTVISCCETETWFDFQLKIKEQFLVVVNYGWNTVQWTNKMLIVVQIRYTIDGILLSALWKSCGGI